MTIPGRDAATLAALDLAADLVGAGAPLFTCKLTPRGDPLPPDGWQNTVPDASVVRGWRPGRALCAVTGVVFDVIDIDPRNGGRESFARLSAELGDNGPEVYLEVATPSGGHHLYIGCLGIGSHKFDQYPGIDLKGGKPDGTGRGFVFIPPTARPAKLGPKRLAGPDRIPYRQTHKMPFRWADDESVAFIRDFTSRLLAERSFSNGSGRPDIDELEDEVVAAPSGAQRDTLLRYVHELERLGNTPREIVSACVALNITNYDPKRPWTRKDFRSLLHAPGEIIGDATADEAADLEAIQPITSGLVRWAKDIPQQKITWLWERYIAMGELTLVDGEKGVAKSMVTDSAVCSATRGLPFPGETRSVHRPINVIYFTDEGTLATVLIPRITASGADLARVAYQGIPAKRGLGDTKSLEVCLPEGAEWVRKMIVEANAGLAIFDPITDLLGEGIRSHEDASVRRALRPLAIILSELGCAGWAIRHMNKDTKADARYRGSGSTAFQNRARVHLIAAELPLYYADTPGTYGLAMVDSNLTARVDGALTYDIEQSSISLDDLGNTVGKVSWQGLHSIDIIHQRREDFDSRTTSQRIDAGEAVISALDNSPTATLSAEDFNAVLERYSLSRNTRAAVCRDIGVFWDAKARVYRAGKEKVR